jgi:hypothetical protein
MENILILITNVCINDCVDFELFKNIKCVDINENKFHEEIMIPHIYCNNKNELTEFMEKQFHKFENYYTMAYLKNLNTFMKEYKLNISIKKGDVLSQEEIINNIKNLLIKVCIEDIDYKVFKNIVSVNIKNDPNSINDYKRYINVFKIDHSKLLTSHAFKFFGCTLIATNNPEEYINKHFKEVLDKIKIKLKIKSMNGMYLDYKKSISLIDAQVDDILKKIEDDDDGVKDQMIEKAYNNKKKFPFPNVLKVNSIEHIESFAKYVKSYDKSLLRENFNCEDIDITQFAVSDEIKILLYMKIGVYCKNLDSNYKDKIFEMVNENKLAMLLCDEEMAYGANFSINKIIITDELGDMLTLNSIFQLIGRTSRVSKSYSGETYIEDKTMDRIIYFFQNIYDNKEESVIISNGFDNYKKYIEEKEINDEIIRINKEKRDDELEKERENQKLKKEELEEKLRLEEKRKRNDEKDNYWSKKSITRSNSSINNDEMSNNKSNDITQFLETKNNNPNLFGSSKVLTSEEKLLRLKMLDEKMNDKELKEKKITGNIEVVENKSSSKLFGSAKVLSVEEKLLRLKLLDEKMSKSKNDDKDNKKSKSSGGFSKDLTDEEILLQKNKEDRINNLYKK